MNQSSTANAPRTKVMDPQDRFTKLDDSERSEEAAC